MKKLKHNPYFLYEGAKYITISQAATVAITQGIIKGNITGRKLIDNPILQKYRNCGAIDTESREAIHQHIKIWNRLKKLAKDYAGRNYQKMLKAENKLMDLGYLIEDGLAAKTTALNKLPFGIQFIRYCESLA